MAKKNERSRAARLPTIEQRRAREDAEWSARCAENEARWLALGEKIERGEIAPPPSIEGAYLPEGESASFAARLADDDPALAEWIEWQHKHAGNPATPAHYAAAQEIVTLLVEALSESYDADGVLPRIEAARRALRGDPSGQSELRERRARFVFFIRRTREHFEAAERGEYPLEPTQLARASYQTLPSFDPAFAKLPFPKFRETITAREWKLYDSAAALIKDAAEQSGCGVLGDPQNTGAAELSKHLKDAWRESDTRKKL